MKIVVLLLYFQKVINHNIKHNIKRVILLKKSLCLLVVTVVTTFFIINKPEAKSYETRGIFISYLEYKELLNNKSEKEIDSIVKKIINNLDKYYINTIYLQVRMFSDSIYKSKIFPKTNIINNDVDLLSTFIKHAKKKNIKIYAWINPYRISSKTDISEIDKNNPAYLYLNTNNIEIIKDKGIYYNPASNIVKNLIVLGVKEIVDNYEIDGIMFDDYFYPSDTIDLNNYEQYKNIISIKDFRLSQVNELIHKVYKMIKSINENVEFGVSPDGNIENNYKYIYADVRKWLSEDGYIDFIMPQLYYGFNHEIKPFIKAANEWNNLIKNDTKLIVALSLYKSGITDEYAKSGSNEWIENTDIISKEIAYSRNLSNYNGYSLFRYSYLINHKNKNLDKEVENYIKLVSTSRYSN